MVLLHGRQLPAGCQRQRRGESARCCRCCRGSAGGAPPIWLQLWIEPSPSWSHWCEKSLVKSIRRPAPLLELPPPSNTQPTQPDNEVALPHPEFSTVPTKTLSRFSRCRRPSLSSKRPLRACQLPPARLQSSSLNEIVNSARPRPSFRRLPPSRARLPGTSCSHRDQESLPSS